MKPVEVLVADDSPADELLTRQALSAEPYPVLVYVARDAVQASQLLNDVKIRPDLIIIDLNVEPKAGFAFLERHCRAFPVIVFTSSTHLENKRRVLELGAKEFVHKPNHAHEFESVVSQIVHNWVSLEGRTRVNKLILELQQRCVLDEQGR